MSTASSIDRERHPRRRHDPAEIDVAKLAADMLRQHNTQAVAIAALTKRLAANAPLRRGLFIATVFEHQMLDGRRLGDLRVAELQDIAARRAGSASVALEQGYERLVEINAAIALASYCQLRDPMATVRTSVRSHVAARIFERARLMASEQLRDIALAQQIIGAASKKQEAR